MAALDRPSGPAGAAGRWDWGTAQTVCLREARRILGPEQAEDVVQEAMLRAWRKRTSCRDPAAPLPWMLQITRNEALRVRARMARRDEVGLEALVAEPALESELEPLAEQLDLRSALARMEAEDRVLLQLRYREDLTQPMAAAVLGLPEGTVKVRLHRLRKQLRQRLEQGSK